MKKLGVVSATVWFTLLITNACVLGLNGSTLLFVLIALLNIVATVDS
jgi:hypothetical protein